MQHFKSLKKKLKKNGKIDLIKTEKAYLFAKKAHSGQKRQSGEDYITHPIAVAEMLNDLSVDESSIITALLHDTVEDANISLKEIEKEFGKSVRHLVEGLTKISKLVYAGNKEERKIDDFYRFILSAAKDIRVIIIKILDRLHNLKTIKHFKKDKQIRIAQETLDIFVPLAYTIGFWKAMVELEDFSFKTINERAYKKIDNYFNKCQKDFGKIVDEFIKTIKNEFLSQGIDVEIKTFFRRKYSFFQKSNNFTVDLKNLPFPLIIKIITKDKIDCYKALGIIHSVTSPRFDRIKDFIATSKENGYSALHTAVIFKHRICFDIHIMTQEMELQNIYGCLHNQSNDKSFNEVLSNIVNLQIDSKNKRKFFEEVKRDILHERIYVFSAEGEVVSISKGSSVIDFVYMIYGEKANYLKKIKINDNFESFSFALDDGDVVESFFGKNLRVNVNWLGWAKTINAKRKIKSYLKSNTDSESLIIGKELLNLQLQRFFNLNIENIEERIKKNFNLLKCKDVNELFIKIGKGKIEIKSLLKILFSEPELTFSSFKLKFSSIKSHKEAFKVKIRIESEDKIGLLRELISLISEQNINIIESASYNDKTKGAVCEFGIEISEFDELFDLCETISNFHGVKNVLKI